MAPVYLDYNATTPMDPRVFEAMRPWFLQPSNSGSRTHDFGRRAKAAVDEARADVANLLDSEPEDVVFTSGATESNNLAILGLAELGHRTDRRHILSTAIEHKSVLEPLEKMSALGFTVELLPVTASGVVEPDEVRRRLREDTLLVSIMHANNETGVLQPVAEIADHIRGMPTLLHTDAAQTFGKEVDALRQIRADLISISSHKIYGPQGIGALCVRRGPGHKRPLSPILFGGGQERGLRPGTVPVALAVGMGMAARFALADHESRDKYAARTRSHILESIAPFPHRINGATAPSQTHVLNVRFCGVDAEALMMLLRDSVAVSNGSACTVAVYKPSHVLAAMGLSPNDIAESVRLSWGGTAESIDVSGLVGGLQVLTKEPMASP